MRVHAVIPDCQVKHGKSIAYLEWIGKYLAEKKPDVIVQIGDFADMPSLSSYDVGKKSFEGRRYRKDIAFTDKAMNTLLAPILAEKNATGWNPRLVLTLGNHEHRIERVVENDPRLEGTIGLEDLCYSDYWQVVPFLKPIIIDGVAYCHYFTSGVMGRPVASARLLVQRKLQSCVMGHVQHWDIHRAVRADGSAVIGLFSGSCYTHDEDYLGPQGNNYDRGFWMLYEVSKGSFQPHYISLSFLKKRYG